MFVVMEAFILSASDNFFCHPHCGSTATKDNKETGKEQVEQRLEYEEAWKATTKSCKQHTEWRTMTYANEPDLVHLLTYPLAGPNGSNEDVQETNRRNVLDGEMMVPNSDEETISARASQSYKEGDGTDEERGENENTPLENKCGVRFNEKANRVYENRYDHRGEDLWYCEEEIQSFRLDHRDIILDMRYDQACFGHVPDSWTKAYRDTYQLFCEETRRHEIDSTYHDHDNETHLVPKSSRSPSKGVLGAPHMVGLERKAIKDISTDAMDRRLRSYEAVFYWQDAPLSSEAVRQHMIARALFHITRPSRLYAAHVAAVTADTLRDDRSNERKSNR